MTEELDKLWKWWKTFTNRVEIEFTVEWVDKNGNKHSDKERGMFDSRITDVELTRQAMAWARAAFSRNNMCPGNGKYECRWYYVRLP